MKKAIIFILTVFGMSMVAGAQSVIVNESLVHDGINAIVTFDIDTEGSDLPSNRKEVIMPYIYNGRDTVWLETVEVYGKNRYKREKQEYFLSGDKNWELDDNQTLRGGTFSYRDVTPLKRWMNPATLGIHREVVGCACDEALVDENVASAPLFQEPPVEPRRIPKDYALFIPTDSGTSDRTSSRSSSRFQRSRSTQAYSTMRLHSERSSQQSTRSCQTHISR